MFFNDQFRVGKTKIGKNNKCFVIAEAGVSHFGSLKKAYKLIDIAVKANADAIKFQLFKTENLYSRIEGLKWFKRMKSREMSYENYEKLINYSKKKNILLFSTAHDEESLDFLIKTKQKFFKVGSGELYNWSFIEKIASLKLPVILSVGMYELNDICKVVEIFKKKKNKNLAILYCTTAYPTSPNDIDLSYIKKIKEKFKLISGYSDHTKGFHIPLLSLAYGAKIIEKHISIDFNIRNAQDWRVSLNSNELKIFVSQIRDVERCLTIKKNKLSVSEKLNKQWATKSIIYKNNLKKGEKIELKDIIVKRPAGGLAPYNLRKIINKKVLKSVQADTFVKFSDFKLTK